MSGMEQAWEDMCHFAKDLERTLHANERELADARKERDDLEQPHADKVVETVTTNKATAPGPDTPRVNAIAPVDAFVSDSDRWAVDKTDYDCLLALAVELERENAELREDARKAVRATILSMANIKDEKRPTADELIEAWDKILALSKATDK